MSSQICPYCNRSHNSRDHLMNHLRFHYQMVLVCPICAGCGSNSWRTIKAHIKACAKLKSAVTSSKTDPGEPLWQRSNNKLKGAPETAATFKLPTWTNPPSDANQEDSSHLFDKTLSGMQEQLKDLEEEADQATKAKMSTCHKKAKDTE